MQGLICLADIPRLTPEELSASIAIGKTVYQEKLDAITNSEELKHKAKRIAARKSSCLKCAFDGNDGFSCWAPYSDAYMEDLDIDPCYEGVLRYLAEKESSNNV